MKKIILGLALLIITGCGPSVATRSGYSNDGREQYTTSSCLLGGYSGCLKQAGEICKNKGFDELYIEQDYSAANAWRGQPKTLTFACGR
jgi:hypothetical protein